MAGVRARPNEPIRTVALMICTRDRPEALDECLAACGALEHGSLAIKICVADNSPHPQERSVRDIAAAHGLDLHYGHETRRGYSSVRNTALDLALASGVDAAIFIDDDSKPAPDLVVEHVAALERYRADAILGMIEGLSQRPKEGRRVLKAGTGNVSIRRWVFDPVSGAGLRFDPRLNLLGFEDWEFFGDLVARGGVIYQSTRPVAISRPDPDALPTSPARPFAARLAFARMEGRNEIATTRIRHGIWAATLKAVRRHLPLVVKGLAGFAVSPFAGARDREAARLRLARGLEGFSGLRKPGFDRPRARAGELIEAGDDT